MKIHLKEIIDFLKLVELKFQKEQKSYIEIDVDEYWIIDTNEWADFSKVPEPAVGSLEDDLKQVKGALEGQFIASYSEIDSLASLLRAISEELAPTNPQDDDA
jgi:hypothetical protein